MTWAADAAGHPDPRALKDSGCLFVGQYVGTQYQAYGVSRGYIDQCLGLGLGVLLIFEEWASQFLGGYDTARQMMDRMHAGWNKLGVPDDGTVCPAVALVDPNPGAVNGHEAELMAFARGVDDGCWLPWFTGYGSRYGLDLAENVAPKMTRRWGVGTWGFGERPDGSLPPNTPADMIQHGNRGAPVPGTDYNTLFRDDMGQWGGPAPIPPYMEEPAMDYILARTDDGLRTLCTALGETEGIDEGYAKALIDGGMTQVKIDGVGYNNMLTIRRAQRAAFLKAIPAGGAAPTKGTWTATA